MSNTNTPLPFKVGPAEKAAARTLAKSLANAKYYENNKRKILEKMKMRTKKKILTPQE